MIALIITESYWENATIEDLEREIIGKVVQAKIDKYTRCHPEVRWALTQGDDFFKWFRVRIHEVRNGARYHKPGTGWTQLRNSRVVRNSDHLIEVNWSPIKVTDSPYRNIPG